MSTIKLRPYQTKLITDIYAAWQQGARNVCAVASTGAGKTVIFGTILRDHRGASCAIAHRRELVGQMSLTLARLGVRHRIIASQGTIREIVTLHMQEVGASYYDATSACAVAGVHTLAKRAPDNWSRSVTLWVQDEAHHLYLKSIWHRAIELFPNAHGLGVTATPCRADGKGLGRHADGVMDVLVEAPPMRWLIDEGYLTDYRIFAPKSDIQLATVPVSETTGDYSAPALRQAAAKSHIVGDVVGSYLKIAPGKLGITFCVSVELAAQTAARYRENGVPAEVVSGDTPELERAAILRRFAKREILQLCNVDLFGEGFDVPAVEVISMARPTQSYGLFCQQFGRGLRPLPGKTHAVIIDHVGNILSGHGLPDTPRTWTLDRRERRSRSAPDDVIPIKACPECTAIYERFLRACPFCGHVPEPASRASPKHVDGDLYELDPTVLAQLRGEIERIDGPVRIPQGLTGPAAGAVAKHHRARQNAQAELREAIAWWAGWQKALGRTDSEGYRRFYLDFGIDVATAQTLGTDGAKPLSERIFKLLTDAGVPHEQ